MSAAWVLFVGIGAGYLINKQLSMASAIQESINMDRDGEHPDVTEIRKVQQAFPTDERYLNMNRRDLSRKDTQFLVDEWDKAKAEVAQFEAGPAPIQGVFFVPDARGV